MFKFWKLDVTLDEYILCGIFDRFEGFCSEEHHNQLMEAARAACIQLEWFGVVKRNRKSRFGYSPTEALIQIILRRGVLPQSKVTRKRMSASDKILVDIIEKVVPIQTLGRGVLDRLGLCITNAHDEYLPTQELHDLVAERLEHIRRDAKGASSLAKRLNVLNATLK